MCPVNNIHVNTLKKKLRLLNKIICSSISYETLHWEKVITVHPSFWRPVKKIKFSRQKCLVIYTGETIARTIRVISFQKDIYFLHRRSPNKGTLVAKSHIFATL